MTTKLHLRQLRPGYWMAADIHRWADGRPFRFGQSSLAVRDGTYRGFGSTPEEAMRAWALQNPTRP